MIRTARRFLAGSHRPGPFRPPQHRQSFDRAFWLVRLFYAATLLITYQDMGALTRLIAAGGGFTPLWPIFWATDIEATGMFVLGSTIAASLLAVALPDRRWPRLLVFLAILAASAFRASFGLGSINHGNHYWLWTAFCFCFLPSGDQEALRMSLASRYRYLLAFAYTQGLILLFYTMSGFWKTAAGIEALLKGKIGTFHPDALATIVADKMLELGRPTLLGPWLTEHAWIGWPVYLVVVYIELVAILAWLRPSLHRLFGLALACFHFGTFLLLGIAFPKHILILTVLLIWSPFLPDRRRLSDVVTNLPGIGYLFGGRRQQPESTTGDTADVTRRGGTA